VIAFPGSLRFISRNHVDDHLRLVITGYCASVHFDGSLGSAGALNGPNIPADRGKQVGGNLFYSWRF
jgi:hypothetical protein